MKYIKIVYGILISSVVAPLVAFAQQGGIWGGNTPFGTPTGYNPNTYSGGYIGGGGLGGQYGQTRSGSITDINQIVAIAKTLLGYMQILIFIAAIFFFLKAAFLFVKGDPGTGSQTLMWAVIGAIIGLLTFTIIPFICFFTQSSGPACGL